MTESGQLALFDLRSFGRLGPPPRTLSPHQVA
jgi:hypothetical protein